MKKVLFLGFTPVQLELARKFVVFRGFAEKLELISEQQSSTTVDAYVANGDDASVASRLALYTRVNPRPVLGTGMRATLGATAYVSGPFKPATVDRLMQMLYGAPPVQDAQPDNVVAFPGSAAAPQAEILVVDDSEMVRKTMARKISEYGHRADVAHNADDAMAMLMNSRYKLVFLDVMMPGMDGFEACRRIKRSAEFKVSAVYMLTSKDGMFDKVRGSMAGCDGYLVKPLEARKLRDVLNTHLGHVGLGSDSDLGSSRVGASGFNDAEIRAIEGSAAHATFGRVEADSPEFKPSFAATAPSSQVKH